jgi:hypothetical protein
MHLSVLQEATGGLPGATVSNPAPLLHILPGKGKVIITMFTIVIWKHNNNAFAINWENGNPGSVYLPPCHK